MCHMNMNNDYKKYLLRVCRWISMILAYTLVRFVLASISLRYVFMNTFSCTWSVIEVISLLSLSAPQILVLEFASVYVSR